MTAQQIIDYVALQIQDPSFDEDYLLDLLNDAMRDLCGGIHMSRPAYGEAVSSPFPDLFTITTIWTSPTLPYVTLPENYQRKVAFLARNSTKQRIEIFNTLMEIAKRYPLMNDTSYIVCAAVMGTKLYYQGILSQSVTSGTGFVFTAATKRIEDPNKGLNVEVGTILGISGTTSNDGDKTVTAVAADYSYVTVSETLVNETNSSTTTVKKGDKLTIHYYRKPATITSLSQTPEAIPEKYHDCMIANYMAYRTFLLIEDGVEDPKINTQKYEDEYLDAMEEFMCLTPVEGESLFLWPDEGRRAYT